MPVFFVEPGAMQNGKVGVTGPLARHLSVSLRVRPGELLWLGVAGGPRYRVRITASSRDRLDTEVVSESPPPPITTPQITLGLALIQGSHMDWAIQKSTELGVARLVPVVTTRSVVRPRPGSADHQAERWQRIAREAAQQSMRWNIPEVATPASFNAWCAEGDPGASKLLFWEDPRGTTLREHLRGKSKPDSVMMAVGPEGGFEHDEVEEAVRNGFELVSLGPRILRTESAVLAALAILQYEWGDLG
jgi:16S rRNA (uracil1498-N3)-methyltransferase